MEQTPTDTPSDQAGTTGTRKMTPYYGGWHYLLRTVMPTMTYAKVAGAEYIPRTGGALLVSNHLSMVDPPLLMAYVPRHIHWMVKAELFEQWPLSVLMPRGDPITVHRGQIDRTALRAAENFLKNGDVVGIFAEGHRSDDAAAQPARAGVVYLAQRTGVPLIPAAISGTEKVFRSSFPWYHHAKIRLTFGPPFYLRDLPAAQARKPDRDRLAFEVMAKVAALLPPEYQGVYRDPVDYGTPTQA
ncbi:MAG: 1-acyl-sn-glycerol-3-phosphate acyltransferase [Herpetosiphonaceae bacterium]|nr:1-acyl-sn-glycerol-3-phosphate acyltransferase [Herpetosiphonaceae bacterium]